MVPIEMTEEEIKKKVFEDTNFKFGTAYGVYSKKFEQSKSDEVKERLNELIINLNSDEITYPQFYMEISNLDHGEEGERRYRFHRTKISGSRKFAARKAEQKLDRVKRHKR
ncbi:MAG: hypothetical protein QGF78_02915 [Candidatus Bathyarchaeota archaeon]|jgi:hypothetical protein|nr:hypothetical protein [Candidatus Bathyarchaeota archaeon]